MSEGLHRIGPNGVTRPFEMDPSSRHLAHCMADMLERFAALGDRWAAALREITQASVETQRAFALLVEPLREIADLSATKDA